jgi:hypothetical protein
MKFKQDLNSNKINHPAAVLTSPNLVVVEWKIERR